RRPGRGARGRDPQGARLPESRRPRRRHGRVAEGRAAGRAWPVRRDDPPHRPRPGRGGSKLRRHAELSPMGRGARLQVRPGEIVMAVEFGVLIPTREAVMSGRPEASPLLTMAERAEAAGFASVWIGDSLTAPPARQPP